MQCCNKKFYNINLTIVHSVLCTKIQQPGMMRLEINTLRQIHKGVSPRGPTPAEISYTCVEIRGRNPRNLEILQFGNLILPLNLASKCENISENIYLLVPRSKLLLIVVDYL